MIVVLEWLGARARWALALGVFAALALPAVAQALRPWLPVLVALVYALSMTRIDLPAVARGLTRPRRAAVVLGLSTVLLTLCSAAAFAAVRALGLPPEWEAAAVWTFAAPPIASAAGFAFLLGLDAALTLEITVVCSALMPILGPLMGRWLLGEDLPLSAVDLALRTAAMIGAGAGLALLLRARLGAERIARRARVFDGLLAVTMIVFAFPLFDGVGETILARPGLAAAFLAVAAAVILGPQLLVRLLPAPPAQAGAVALTGGTRSVAIWLAALPPDPLFTLWVALYQLPMYATPLLMRRSDGAR